MNRWISEQYPNSSLNELFLPGTHHSAMDEMLLRSPIDSYKIFEYLTICFVGLRKLTVTQDYNVYDQLNMGIRVLDLRGVYYEGDTYLYHGFLGHKLYNILAQIKRFALENPKEPFVVIYIGTYFIGSIGDTLTFTSITNSLTTPSIVMKKEMSYTIPYVRTCNVEEKYNNILNNLNYTSNGFNTLDIALTPSVFGAIVVMLPYILLIPTLTLLSSIILLLFANKGTKTMIKIHVRLIFGLIVIILTTLAYSQYYTLKQMAERSNKHFLNNNIPFNKPITIMGDFMDVDIIDKIINLNTP